MTLPPLPQLREDYARWHRAQVATGDIDPMYPVLAELGRQRGFTPSQLAWAVVLHVVWYHPGSTVAALELVPTMDDLPRTPEGLEERGLLRLPTGTERRGHRAVPPLVQHLLSLPRHMPDGPLAWAEEAASAGGIDPRARWTAVNERLLAVPGYGRWAAYKTAEMWQKVAGLEVEAADAGHRYSSGPRKGLEIVEGPGRTPPRGQQDAAAVRRLDALTQRWADRLEESDLAQVETSLCDFYSLTQGRYYLGHDIDSMQEAWAHPRISRYVTSSAWEARAASFPASMLGEVYGPGRGGVDRERNRAYRDTGVLDLSAADNLERI